MDISEELSQLLSNSVDKMVRDTNNIKHGNPWK